MNNQREQQYRAALQQCVEAMEATIRSCPALPRQQGKLILVRSIATANNLLNTTGPKSPDPLPEITKVKIGDGLYDTCEFQVTPDNGVVITLDKPETVKQRLELLADVIELSSIELGTSSEPSDIIVNGQKVLVYVGPWKFFIQSSDLRRAAEEVFGE